MRSTRLSLRNLQDDVFQVRLPFAGANATEFICQGWQYYERIGNAVGGCEWYLLNLIKDSSHSCLFDVWFCTEDQYQTNGDQLFVIVRIEASFC